MIRDITAEEIALQYGKMETLKKSWDEKPEHLKEEHMFSLTKKDILTRRRIIYQTIPEEKFSKKFPILYQRIEELSNFSH